MRKNHGKYAHKNLWNRLKHWWIDLDTNRIWICFWLIHVLDLLGELNNLSEKQRHKIILFILRCQNPSGGYGGSPGNYSHLAPTFAAICTLLTIGVKHIFNSINRENLLCFLISCKNKDGSFSVHIDGECDVRAIYCTFAVAIMMNVLTNILTQHSSKWIISCQTYEGAICAESINEAHGGYSFCGLTSLVLINEENKLDLRSFLNWTCCRQMDYSGGFQGRTNKLVDGCYSYWIGSIFIILKGILFKKIKKYSKSYSLFNKLKLQYYLINCCQFNDGGFIDKPPKKPDFYHTCYVLSGLSISQYSFNGTTFALTSENDLLRKTHLLFNICSDRIENSKEYFLYNNNLNLYK